MIRIIFKIRHAKIEPPARGISPLTLRQFRMRFILTVALLLFLQCHIGSAQSKEYRIKAVMMVKLPDYVESTKSNRHSDDTYKIAVIGENPFGNLLKDASKEHFRKGSAEVKTVSKPEEIGDCDMLFISGSQKKELSHILRAVQNKGILIVGDTPGYAEAGVHINFYINNNKVGFIVNESALIDSGFKIDYRLRKIAKIINRKPRNQK